MSVTVQAAWEVGGLGSCWSRGDLVRYPPATTPAIPDAESVIVDSALQAGAGFPGVPGVVGVFDAEGLGSADLLVRRAESGDRAALEAMFQRCSPQTVYRRFHGHLRAFPARFLDEAVAGVPKHFALVACCGSRVVAMASCVLADPGPDRGTSSPGASSPGASSRGASPGASSGAGSRTAELGVLVEDEFQRHGLGRLLLAGLVAHAHELGLPTLQAQVLVEQDWITGLLGEFGRCESTFQRGVREVTLHLSPERAGLDGHGTS